MARPRKYPPELLDRGARVVIESGRPIAHVARDLGVPAETLRRTCVGWRPMRGCARMCRRRP
jgi:transposase-like protein